MPVLYLISFVVGVHTEFLWKFNYWGSLWRFCKHRRIGRVSLPRPEKWKATESGVSNLFKQNVAASVNHAEWAERAPIGADWHGLERTHRSYLLRFVFSYSAVAQRIQMRVQRAKVAASRRGSTSSNVPTLFFIPGSFPSIDLIQPRLLFRPVCCVTARRLPLDGGEGTACQGQSCALMSDRRWTAGLTPVPFTPEASWHYLRVVFSITLARASALLSSAAAAAAASRLRLPIQYIPPLLRRPRLDSGSGSHMWQADRRGKEKEIEEGGRWRWWQQPALASHWALCACYSMRSHRQERARGRGGEEGNERATPRRPSEAARVQLMATQTSGPAE